MRRYRDSRTLARRGGGRRSALTRLWPWLRGPYRLAGVAKRLPTGPGLSERRRERAVGRLPARHLRTGSLGKWRCAVLWRLPRVSVHRLGRGARPGSPSCRTLPVAPVSWIYPAQRRRRGRLRPWALHCRKGPSARRGAESPLLRRLPARTSFPRREVIARRVAPPTQTFEPPDSRGARECRGQVRRKCRGPGQP